MYNITGWSGGGRRPLSYNLMPGQFRNTRVNVFSQPTIINNMGGFGGYYDCGCGCDCGSNKMNWMDWTMIGGMGLNFLGGILSCFWGGGGGSGAESATGTGADRDKLASARADAKAIKDQYDVKVSVMSDGTFMVKGKRYDTIDEVIEALQEPEEEPPIATHRCTVADVDTLQPIAASKGATVTFDSASGKLIITHGNPPIRGEVVNLTEALGYLNTLTNAPAQPSAGTVNPERTGTTKKALGEAWNAVDFTNGQFDIKLVNDKGATSPELQFSATNDTTVEGTGSNIGAPAKITITKDGKKYEFTLVDDPNWIKDGNPMYICTTANGVALNDRYQQQFYLTPDGNFVQADNVVGDTKGLGNSNRTRGYTQTAMDGRTWKRWYKTDEKSAIPAEIKTKIDNGEINTVDKLLEALGIPVTQQNRDILLDANPTAMNIRGQIVNKGMLDIPIAN